MQPKLRVYTIAKNLSTVMVAFVVDITLVIEAQLLFEFLRSSRKNAFDSGNVNCLDMVIAPKQMPSDFGSRFDEWLIVGSNIFNYPIALKEVFE